VTAPAVLAVDGGNSKADVALVATDGSLIGAVRGMAGGMMSGAAYFWTVEGSSSTYGG
jgi:hypothetical protein